MKPVALAWGETDWAALVFLGEAARPPADLVVLDDQVGLVQVAQVESGQVELGGQVALAPAERVRVASVRVDLAQSVLVDQVDSVRAVLDRAVLDRAVLGRVALDRAARGFQASGRVVELVVPE